MTITIKIPSFQTITKGKIKLEPCVPSWNEILGMEHWGRAKKKQAIQSAFLSALLASASDSSTRTTSARNTLSTAAATLASYLTTTRDQRESKRLSAKLSKGKRSTP